MEQTTKDSRIIEPLHVLFVSGEFPIVSWEKDAFSFQGVNTSFNDSSRFQIDRENGFTYASMNLTSPPEEKKYDVLLTDLSLSTWLTGSPVDCPNNYGLILALQAVRVGVPYIGVVFNREDAQVGRMVLESMIGVALEKKDRGVFTIQHGQQISKMLIASAPIYAGTDVKLLSQKDYFALFKELLRDTPHEQYSKGVEEET